MMKKRYRVEFMTEINVPDELTEDDIEDWFRFTLGDNGTLDGRIYDAMGGQAPEPVIGTLFVDSD